MRMAEFLLLLQAAATLAMVGLIWFVQVVHYPLFGRVGRDGFAGYERAHQQRTTLVVAPLMLVEAFTALVLLWLRPDGVSLGTAIAGAVLVGLIWTSTLFWQVPAHARLEKSYNALDHRKLVRSNWVRSAGWSLRGVLLCWIISQLFIRGVSSGSADYARWFP